MRRWMVLVLVLAGACGDLAGSEPSTTVTRSVPASTTATTEVPVSSTTMVAASVDLPRSSPEEQGMDSEVLVDLVDRAVAEGGIDSVTVVRHGHVVLDSTVYPFPAGATHQLMSVTKSVIGTLVGIAIDEGLLAGVDVRVVDVLSDHLPGRVDGWMASMTVEDLLTMQSGLECRDSAPFDWEGMRVWMVDGDWTENILGLPMASEPGTQFEYCNGVSHLLSAVLTAVTGRTAAAFADEVLFEPLGIDTYVWPTAPDGITAGFSDLGLRPIDAAKIGQLYLQGGEWAGRRVLSSGWVEAATADQVVGLPSLASGYGYQWWVEASGWIAARGYAGQHIFLIPPLDAVVVFTSGLAPNRTNLPYQLVTNYVLAAAKPGSLPPNPSGLARLDETVARAEAGPGSRPVDLPPMAESVNRVRYESDPNDHGHQWFELGFEDGIAHLSLSVDLSANPDDPRPTDLMAMRGYENLDQPLEVDIGLDGRFVVSDTRGQETGWRGGWLDDHTFQAEAQCIGRQTHERATYRFTFDGDTAQLRIAEATSGLVQQSSAHTQP